MIYDDQLKERYVKQEDANYGATGPTGATNRRSSILIGIRDYFMVLNYTEQIYRRSRCSQGKRGITLEHNGKHRMD